jgi:hypothetical protein
MLQFTIPKTSSATLSHEMIAILRDTLRNPEMDGGLAIMRPLSSDEGFIELGNYTNVIKIPDGTLLTIVNATKLPKTHFTMALTGLGEHCATAIEDDASLMQLLSRMGGRQHDATAHADLHFLPGGTLVEWSDAGVNMSIAAERRAQEAGRDPATAEPNQADFEICFHAIHNENATRQDIEALSQYAGLIVPRLLARTAQAWGRSPLAETYSKASVAIA